MQRKWINRKELNNEEILNISQKYGVPPMVAAVLLKRDIKDIDNFLDPVNGKMYNPLLLKDISKACNIIKTAITQNEKICVVNDYDVDGVTSGVIMKEAINDCGGDVIVCTPDRNIDGYGISYRIIDFAKDSGCTLIVTTDNGISASKQIAYAKEQGIKVIVTDHHEVPFKEVNGKKTYILPEADAVIDPKQEGCTYPFKEICGAVVAYKVSEVLFDLFDLPSLKKKSFLDRFMELACIGSICDVMPLIDENRTIVIKGLELLKTSSWIGLRQLFKEMSINPAEISSYNIGFHIGPCINSVSRMTGSAEKAMSLFFEKDHLKAGKIAFELKGINDERKNICNQEEQRALEIAKFTITPGARFITLYIPNSHPSLMGIIAGRILEIYSRPVICLTDDKEYGMLKGSGRSIKGCNLYELLSNHSELFEKFGGHELAAGLSVKSDNLTEMITSLDEDTDIIEPEPLLIDIFINLKLLNKDIITSFNVFGPYGEGNPPIMFASENLKLTHLMRIGKNKEFIRMSLTDGEELYEAVYFGNADEFDAYYRNKYGTEIVEGLYNGLAKDVFADIVFSPSVNYYKGEENISINVKYFR